MLDPNMTYQLGKLRQQELIQMGQDAAKARGNQPRRLNLRPLLTLLMQMLGR
jgi:hypothetical protein